MRRLTHTEIEAVRALGTYAEDWSEIFVSEDFQPEQLQQSRLCGRVEVGSGARIIGSTVTNYRIGARSLVEQVVALQCRHRSSFGNGVKVATMNENGGRAVPICDTMSAQTAYMIAFYRHRPQLIAVLEALVGKVAEERSDTLGTVGEDCTLTGARFIREVRIGNRVTVDGASLLENGTLCDDTTIGIDVKAEGFIVAEGARVSGGVTIEHGFVGESCILDNIFRRFRLLHFRILPGPFLDFTGCIRASGESK